MKKLSMFVLLGVLLGTLTAGSALADPAAQAVLHYGSMRACSDTNEFQVHISISGIAYDYAGQMIISRGSIVLPVVEGIAVTPLVTGGQVGYLSYEAPPVSGFPISAGAEYVVDVMVVSIMGPEALETRRFVAGPCYGAAAAGVDALAAWRANTAFMSLIEVGAPAEFDGMLLVGGVVVKGEVGDGLYEVGYWSDGAYLALGWFDDDGNVAANPDGPLTDAQLSLLLRILKW